MKTCFFTLMLLLTGCLTDLRAQENDWQLQRTNVKFSLTNLIDFTLPVASLSLERRFSNRYGLNLEVGLPIQPIWKLTPTYESMYGLSLRTGHRFYILRQKKKQSRGILEVMGTYQNAHAIIAGDFSLISESGSFYFRRLNYGAALNLYRGSIMIVLQQDIIKPFFFELGVGLKLTYRRFYYDLPDNAFFRTNGSKLSFWTPSGSQEQEEAFFPGYGLYLNLGWRF